MLKVIWENFCFPFYLLLREVGNKHRYIALIAFFLSQSGLVLSYAKLYKAFTQQCLSNFRQASFLSQSGLVLSYAILNISLHTIVFTHQMGQKPHFSSYLITLYAFLYPSKEISCAIFVYPFNGMFV